MPTCPEPPDPECPSPSTTVPHRPIQKYLRAAWKVLLIMWASPYSLLGICIGGVGILCGGAGRFRDGAFEFYGGGTAQFVRRQFERWGPLMGPAYLGASAWMWLSGRDAYRDNPFEVQAYREAP